MEDVIAGKSILIIGARVSLNAILPPIEEMPHWNA